MKAHNWPPNVTIPAQSTSAESLTAAPQAYPLGRATRGVIVLAILLGGIGAEAAVASGTVSVNHSGASPAANTALSTQRPWMY
jgi:hypothetical protein